MLKGIVVIVNESEAEKLKVIVEVQKRSVEHVVDVPMPQERVVLLIFKGVVEVAQCFPQASCQVKEIPEGIVDSTQGRFPRVYRGTDSWCARAPRRKRGP